MSEKLPEGPVWDQKYGDNPMTGEYEFVGHRMELPGRSGLFFAERYPAEDNIVIFNWSTELTSSQVLQKLSSIGVLGERDTRVYLEREVGFLGNDESLAEDELASDEWSEHSLEDFLFDSSRVRAFSFEINGSRVNYKSQHFDERVDGFAEVGIVSGVLNEEYVRCLVSATANDGIVARLDQLIEASEIF